MNEQSQGFEHLLKGLALLHEALGKSANLQTGASRSANPRELGVTIFLRDQRHTPRISLVFPGDGPIRRRSTSDPLVYVVNKAPAQLIKRWRDSAQSFIDLQGSVFIEVPGLFIDKTVARRRIESAASGSVDPFADKASRISRWLLTHHPRDSWGVRELSKVANVSLGTTSKIVRTLEQRGLITVSREGRTATVSVGDATKLFVAWVAVYDWTRNVALRLDAPIAEPKSFVKSLPRRLARIDERWALTLQSGAAFVTSHAVWDQIHVYVDVQGGTQLNELAAQLNWRPSPEGKLTLLRPYYRNALWGGVTTREGIPVVDCLQLGLDLWHYPVRGREQAQHLFRRTLPWIEAELA